MYEKCCLENNPGAVLFMYARGNFSEGYNFKQDLCRAVIVIGVPNLNLQSPKVLMKYAKFNKGFPL